MEPNSTPLTPDEKALVAAALNGDAGRVRELLANGVGADPRESETHPLGLEWNVTPLMCAAAGGHLEVVRLLLDAGADVSAATEAHKQDGGGGSQALHFALLGNHLAAAEALLDTGADPNAISGTAARR